MIDKFLYGGEGITVVKFKVAEDAIGGIFVGKGEYNDMFQCAVTYIIM